MQESARLRQEDAQEVALLIGPEADPRRDRLGVGARRLDDRAIQHVAVARQQDPVGRVDAERLEVAAETRARREADASVDWTRTDDALRAPRFTYPSAAAGGCGALFVYAWSADRMESITLDIRAPLAPGASQVFDLASAVPVVVTTTVFERPQGQPGYCSDVSIDDGHLRTTWRAIRGRLHVTRSAEGIRVSQPGMSRVVIDLDHAEFVSDAGLRLLVGPIRVSAPVEQTGSRVVVIP